MAVTVIQVKMRNSDSYLTQINGTIEDAERYIWSNAKFLKLLYDGALVYLAVNDITSIAVQEPREESTPESFEEVLDKQ